MIEFNRRETMKKCEGCKRAKGSNTVYTCNCNCNVESKKVESIDNILATLWELKTSDKFYFESYGKELLKEYATQQKESIVSNEEIIYNCPYNIGTEHRIWEDGAKWMRDKLTLTPAKEEVKNTSGEDSFM